MQTTKTRFEMLHICYILCSTADHQDRFSPASLKSFAQNVNGSWTAAGFLNGRLRKTRSVPLVTPVNVVFCLFLGHLEGLSGQRLFTSQWMNLLPGRWNRCGSDTRIC